MFQRILVANRGEIALRVIRACRDLGIEVVAVFSEADRDAPYLSLADEAICIGPATASLAKNPHSPEFGRSCNIDFSGPPQEAMRRLGNKNEARKLAQKAGVPVVPGSAGLIDTDAEALRLAQDFGYP